MSTLQTTRDVVSMRSVDEVLSGPDMGGSWPTRHSFARTFVRTASTQRWNITRTRLDLDRAGCGTVAYRIDAQGYTFHFVAFSQTIGTDQRTDRVVASAWDVTAALIEGELTPGREAALRANVPRQEHGRYDAGTVIVTRANRSVRFFDYVATCLADGRMPDAERIGPSPYILRSTAYYGNGKFGLKEFEDFPADHPLAIPYRSQMLAAWLFREVSIDMVEQVARGLAATSGSGAATALDPAWGRYLGVGNATGLGMVPFVVNHPEILDAWASMRELPLAAARRARYQPADPELGRVATLLQRADEHFAEKDTLRTAPFLPAAQLRDQLADLAATLDRFRAGETRGEPTAILESLYQEAARLGPEARGVFASIITELHDDSDLEIETQLTVSPRPALDASMSCGQLLYLVRQHYGWAAASDFAAPDRTAYYWFTSETNEEPRRAHRESHQPEPIEHSTDVARRVNALAGDLRACRPGESLAIFLVNHPWHRFAAGRVQQTQQLRYGELRANLLDNEFLPLQAQRFQLACYGATNYSPQSTDWLRVTLFSGAPRPADLRAGVSPDWLFPTAPEKETVR